jgi:hypothetical protein
MVLLVLPRPDANKPSISWEPVAHLGEGCSDLLTRFWKEVGIDNGDYHEGYVCRPSKEWIGTALLPHLSVQSNAHIILRKRKEKVLG